ncbi:MAG TPA: Hsp20 family protein [Stellaceae bacterium]|nr:Hsp20 family protein [Stellaceae bacterium]
MTGFDFSPLFRSTIGFDRLARLADIATRGEGGNVSYPPYNIEVTGDNTYRLTMAVAGFGPQDIELTAEEGELRVTGKASADRAETRYLYRGLARRAFERHFHLADHLKVTGASLDNGLLHIELQREVPEALKPRRIAISTGTPAQVTEAKAA